MAAAASCCSGALGDAGGGKRGSSTQVDPPEVSAAGKDAVLQHWRSAGPHRGPCTSMREIWKLQFSMTTRQARARAVRSGMVQGIAELCTQSKRSKAAADCVVCKDALHPMQSLFNIQCHDSAAGQSTSQDPVPQCPLGARGGIQIPSGTCPGRRRVPRMRAILAGAGDRMQTWVIVCDTPLV